MIITPRIKEAMDLSARVHRKQKHGSVVYFIHTFEVMFVLVEHGVVEEDALCTGALHDSIEDSGLTYDDIARDFGTDVAGYVSELTDDPRLPRNEQLKQQISSMRHKSYIALCCKLADRIANLRRGPGQRTPRARRLDHSSALAEMAEIRIKGLDLKNGDPAIRLLLTLFALIKKHLDEGAC